MASDSNTAKFDGRCLLRLYLLMIITLIRLRPAAGELHAVKHVRLLYICRVLTDHLANEINQGPLKKWTKHSQELHLLKIHSRGGSYYTLGLDGG